MTRGNAMVADLQPSLESLVGAKQPVVAEGDKPKKMHRTKRPVSNDVAAQQEAPAQTPVTQPAYGAADSGPRYMAPVAAAMPAYPRTGAASGGAAATTASIALDPTLPPQAYRGPSSR